MIKGFLFKLLELETAEGFFIFGFGFFADSTKIDFGSYYSLLSKTSTNPFLKFVSLKSWNMLNYSIFILYLTFSGIFD